MAVLQSFVYAEVASAGLKVLTCRTRPSDSNIQHPTSNIPKWQGPFASFESTSFPSGHAMRSFAVATTVAGFYPEKKWVGIVSYSLMILPFIFAEYIFFPLLKKISSLVSFATNLILSGNVFSSFISSINGSFS